LTDLDPERDDTGERCGHLAGRSDVGSFGVPNVDRPA
jgi:hypothetical protein